ncbi:ANTH domain-containing protein [Multifurca ochricompacta]|uniref:ANTH domain-containing protein n=1 Tax=Multifurca ochricompacta TaxID=376703 RepID=A0AAD4QNQ4_9AGAM|nr:ANTH domain-containing protein [Multifurca ochricompacta]
MSSFEKVVKNACKPKPTAPKSKVSTPILVVFKALIVLHTMIRNGSTDNVLRYLSSSEVLRLKNVAGGQWEGYNAPKNLQHYALYLDARIRAYRDLKHDAIRVQSETNRDMRLSMSLQEDARRHPLEDDARKLQSSGAPSRSKTIMGRKLRVMTVEKGLLRETKVVQKVMDVLVECRFYLDDLEDELTVLALRMLVKDLLTLFQAVNEGVINVLEHYFEMSYIDAEQALAIYQHFCKQAMYVVEFLGVAKKLQNLLNVPIPNLKHAPVSLVGALEEYLNDPNFEQNRIEYRANKDAADRNLKNGRSNQKKVEKAIEDEQTTIFNSQTGSPTSGQFQQQSVYNPFNAAGSSGASTNPFPQIQVQSQPTGFLQPQITAVPGALQQPTNPFPTLQAMPTGFLQPQTTGQILSAQVNQLQPVPTGANPFSVQNVFPGTNPFPTTHPTNPFPVSGQMTNTFPPATIGNPFVGLNHNSVSNAANSSPLPSFNLGPFPAQPRAPVSSVPARPASTPLTQTKPSSPPLQPLKPHQTGSRNPFGVPKAPSPPPVPRAPTLFELASSTVQPQLHSQNPAQVRPQPTGLPGSTFASVASSFIASGGSGAQVPQLTASTLTSVGSSTTSSTPASASTTTATVSTFSDLLSNSPSGLPTASTALSSQPTGAPLRPQTTGFNAGIKAFKPTSSFGASLLETLPPIPQSAPTTPALEGGPYAGYPPAGAVGTGGGATPAGVGLGASLSGGSSPASGTGIVGVSGGGPGLGGSFGLSVQPTGFSTAGARSDGLTALNGSSLGVGLRPQATGIGVANPFRASMLAPGSGAFPGFNVSNTGAGAGAALFSQPTGASPFGQGFFGGAQADASKQQNGAAPLI